VLVLVSLVLLVLAAQAEALHPLEVAVVLEIALAVTALATTTAEFLERVLAVTALTAKAIAAAA